MFNIINFKLNKDNGLNQVSKSK